MPTKVDPTHVRKGNDLGWRSTHYSNMAHHWYSTHSGRSAISSCGQLVSIYKLAKVILLPHCSDCELAAELRQAPGVERS